ncbi:hypothetical protein [Pontibacillus yanchengensis]|uniref:FAD/FMN-containing dehydrogenase n=1 Tax=Pontibacillus yanchengensis Y32 TaxID=1385514 RepID=A0A0A2TEM6_9BACI|nr:hypothetical protein [Pontibacillus yanchengensis]KGP74287.1 hypothetical protein N782_15125 [Pontibacillus yanchengensis Y32]
MKKKFFSALLVLLIVLGLSNVVMAHGDENTRGHSMLGFDVAEMIPWMKDMHPNMSEEEINEMYRDCHQNQ